MHLQNPVRNMLCGAALVFALAALPATAAVSRTGNSSSMSSASKVGQMDINSATVDQLRTLTGIGDAYARRIVAGRPYNSKNQLVTKGILPRSVYEKVQSRIIATHAKKQISDTGSSKA